MPRLLELFSGTKSVSKVARELGWQTLSLDWDSTHNPDLLLDILDFDETEYPKDYFQFIWASPDCASYSRARSRAKMARTDAMESADKLLAKCMSIVDYFDCHWCIENPAGSQMWKRDIARHLLQACCLTSYCSFGSHQYRKDTRIANSFGLILPRCQGAGLCPAMIGSRHKEHAQKGGGGTTNRYHTLDELHSIPSSLCRSVLAQVYRRITDRPAGQAGID